MEKGIGILFTLVSLVFSKIINPEYELVPCYARSLSTICYFNKYSKTLEMNIIRRKNQPITHVTLFEKTQKIDVNKTNFGNCDLNGQTVSPGCYFRCRFKNIVNGTYFFKAYNESAKSNSVDFYSDSFKIPFTIKDKMDINCQFKPSIALRCSLHFNQSLFMTYKHERNEDFEILIQQQATENCDRKTLEIKRISSDFISNEYKRKKLFIGNFGVILPGIYILHVQYKKPNNLIVNTIDSAEFMIPRLSHASENIDRYQAKPCDKDVSLAEKTVYGLKRSLIIKIIIDIKFGLQKFNIILMKINPKKKLVEPYMERTVFSNGQGVYLVTMENVDVGLYKVYVKLFGGPCIKQCPVVILEKDIHISDQETNTVTGTNAVIEITTISDSLQKKNFENIVAIVCGLTVGGITLILVGIMVVRWRSRFHGTISNDIKMEDQNESDDQGEDPSNIDVFIIHHEMYNAIVKDFIKVLKETKFHVKSWMEAETKANLMTDSTNYILNLMCNERKGDQKERKLKIIIFPELAKLNSSDGEDNLYYKAISYLTSGEREIPWQHKIIVTYEGVKIANSIPNDRILHLPNHLSLIYHILIENKETECPWDQNLSPNLIKLRATILESERNFHNLYS